MGDTELAVNASEPAPDTQAPASAGNDATNTSPESRDNSPSSSEATTVSDREALLSVVQNAVQPDSAASETGKPDTRAETSNPVSSEPNAAPQESPADEPDPTDAELADMPRKTQKRIRQLLDQRRQIMQERDGLKGEVDQLRAHADQYQNLQNYLVENQISQQDFQMLVHAGTILRHGDFDTFIKIVEPYVDAAKQALGRSLPDDLRNKVDGGLMPEDEASELARLRFQTHRQQEQMQSQQERLFEQQHVQRTEAIRAAVDTWQQQLRSRDPDFDAILEDLQDKSRALIQRNGGRLPSSPDEAIRLAQEAYDSVKKSIARYRPAMQPTRPGPSSSSVSSNATTAEPKNLFEAVALGLRRANEG